MGEQPVWEEFLERMEETFKEYLEDQSFEATFKEFLEKSDLSVAFAEKFENFLMELDLGYVIQNFLERFRLEDYLERDQSKELIRIVMHLVKNHAKYPTREANLKILEQLLVDDKAMKEDKKIDLDKAFKIITDLELWNEDNIVELRTHEVFSIIQASTMKLRKALGDE